MLCEELSLGVSTLLKGLIRQHTYTKKNFRDCTAKYFVKVSADQFKIAYCPALKGLNIHKKKHYIAQQKLTLSLRLHSEVLCDGSRRSI